MKKRLEFTETHVLKQLSKHYMHIFENLGSNDGDLQMLEARKAVIPVNFLSRKPRLPRAIGHRATFATFWTS